MDKTIVKDNQVADELIKPKKTREKRILIWFVFITYSSFLLFCMFLGFDRPEHFVLKKYSYNLIPFKNIGGFVDNAIHGKAIIAFLINIVGNIVVFIPIGFLLPLLFKKINSFKKFSLVFVSVIIVLEISQILLHVGVADIDDLILNYIGGVIGWKLFQHFSLKKVSG